jgi:TolA-binding protein
MESNVAQIPLSHKAWGWFEANRQKALMGAAAAVLVIVIAWFLIWQHGQKEITAGNALSDVTAAQMSAPGAAQENPQAYLKVAADYAGSAAAARAVLIAAGAYFMDGKYGDAQTTFEKFIREYRSSPLIGQALLGVAACYEAQGKDNEALTAYKDIYTRHPNDSVVPQARFAAAGLYEKQKKPELARDLYEQVERDSRFSILGSEAGMRLEELAEKNPNLAPAVTNAPVLPVPTLAPLAATNPPAQPPKK